MKKIIGILCLFYPFLTWIALAVCDVEYFWYFFENFKTIDLMHSLVVFLIFVLGLNLVNSSLSSKSYILFFVSIPFLFYLMIRWEFTTTHYIAKKEVNAGIDLVLVLYDAGAFSTDSFVNLEIVERIFLIFIQRKTIKSYDKISSGDISLLSDNIEINLKTYKGDLVSERFIVNDLISK